MSFLPRPTVLLSLFLALVSIPIAAASEPRASSAPSWESAVRRLLHDLRGANPHRVELHYRQGRTEANGELAWADDQTFSIAVRAEGRSVAWRRSERECSLELGTHGARFQAVGPGLETGDYRALLATLATSNRDVRRVHQVLFATPIFAVLPILRAMAVDEREPRFRVGDLEVALDVREGRVHEVLARGADLELTLRFTGYRPPPTPEEGWERTETIPREELEGTFVRGLARAVEILDGDRHAEPLEDLDRRSGTGRLVVRDGHRILLLHGDPRSNGRAHGSLLKEEVRRLMASTLDVVGLVYTIEKGTWFPGEIRRAWESLRPHVLESHLEELRGIAEGAEIPFERVCLGNVFPELFHCSGFALAGSATVGGKLLHGRVLDYMTEIGLQRNAVLVVQASPGREAFANIGYAGFVGSVSGMNERGISIGEMGGRGEGLWDGMPMAFLVRHALESATSLEEAIHVFKSTPRTCEYFYVIGDGRARSGVGVAAWPRRIEFLGMGTRHELLPEAIEGAVLLSAGDRYRCLVDRVRASYGRIDEERALELMLPGVAMRGNLHDVLFVPEDLVLHVAHAPRRGTGQAALEPYARFDLKEWFERARGLHRVPPPGPGPGSRVGETAESR